MIIVRINGMDVTAELVRQAAKDKSFDEQSVLFFGEYHGYRDAPNPTTQEIKNARDEIVADLENEYPVTIETFTAAEQDGIMRERYTDPDTGDENLPEWYDSPQS